MKIVALVGSVSGTKTKVALQHVLDGYDQGHDKSLLCIGEYQLEFSDGRKIDAYNEDTQYVVNELLAADIIIVGTPTYQTSIPGALKNVFDLLPMQSLKDKTVGIVALAGSPKHYLMVESQLKPILAYMGALLVQKYVFIEDADFESGALKNPRIQDRIRALCYDSLFIATSYRSSLENYHPQTY